MPTDRELMRMALDALKETETYNTANREQYQIEVDAIEALRARLAQPKPEPVAWVKQVHDELQFSATPREGFEPLYTTPPQREWQWLTDEDLGVYTDKLEEFARAIEAKLKEKNT